ncbi:uncharacterized protein LOC117647350 [Thrips palmi]|uniref:Uncharacterized protein LOC117647350 n=1 Tax=Thrips palmi TaxID=161013 RepID=A0A6P8ZBC5_THRPL|nr:uncharacterized protein LOC117647350 [Thrips palmi]XP_034244972.1 uncharacterized protein LOC117647350 [Thrips palmi]
MLRALLLAVLLWGGPPGRRQGSYSASAAKWINSFAGPFIPVMGPFTDCLDNKSEDLVKLNVKVSQHRNRQIDSQTQLQKITGNVTVAMPLTNKGWMYLKAASRSNNQWKDNAHILKFTNGMCRATAENMPGFVRSIYKLDPEKLLKSPCVIPPGVYLADETPVNFTVPRLPIFQYGTWRTEIGYNLGTEAKPRNIMCFMTDIYTVPKL